MDRVVRTDIQNVWIGQTIRTDTQNVWIGQTIRTDTQNVWIEQDDKNWHTESVDRERL